MLKSVEAVKAIAEYNISPSDSSSACVITGILTPPGYRVISPIEFSLSRRKLGLLWIARAGVDLFGVGHSIREAVDDLAGELVTGYQSLGNEPAGKLAPVAQKRAEWLRTRLEFTPNLIVDSQPQI